MVTVKTYRFNKAGSGNRTRINSLEGCGFTTKLCPRLLLLSLIMHDFYYSTSFQDWHNFFEIFFLDSRSRVVGDIGIQFFTAERSRGQGSRGAGEQGSRGRIDRSNIKSIDTTLGTSRLLLLITYYLLLIT